MSRLQTQGADLAATSRMSGVRKSRLRLIVRSSRALLAAIILGACSLATYWVFLVPILQAPDELNHLKTAFDIYSAGKLISVREPLHRWNSDLTGGHVYTSYLERATNAQSLVFHYDVKIAPGYGTRDYYDSLDRNAPAQDSGNLEGMPRIQSGMLTTYPCGYYVALAGWLRIVSLFTGRVTRLFFGARIFSVFLLSINLCLMYLTMRELALGASRALLVTAIVGFFPLTTFVSSYAQADNFTLTMVMLSCYMAMRVRRDFPRNSTLVVLGLALGGLCLAKYHFFAAVFPAVLGLVVAENLARETRVRWVKLSAILLAPPLVAVLIHIWITHGSDPGLVLFNQSTQNVEFSVALGHGKIAATGYLIKGIGLAFSNFYLNGDSALTSSTFNTFWGDFGWTDTPLIIFTPWKTNIIRNFIAAVDVAVFLATIVRLGYVITRLRRLVRRGRTRRALRILFSNPLINSYFLFTVMMFGLFIVARRSYAPQGRNWFPFILPIFLTPLFYAPRALGSRRLSTILSRALFAGLVLYCILGSYYAIPSIVNRYYNVHAVRPSILTQP